ncbi:MAG: hypothetical protein WD425_13930 [Nitrospirales bacterium]
MWNLIDGLNCLRNYLSHSLDSKNKKQNIQSIGTMYDREFPDRSPDNIDRMNPDSVLCMLALSGCLGFIFTFIGESKTFEELANLHRPPSKE